VGVRRGRKTPLLQFYPKGNVPVSYLTVWPWEIILKAIYNFGRKEGNLKELREHFVKRQENCWTVNVLQSR